MPQCSTCLDPLSHLHACLHCIYIGCWKKGHIKDHQKEKKHNFGKESRADRWLAEIFMLNYFIAMDFDRHTLFCYECNDYIYDTEIDEKITRAELLSSKLICVLNLPVFCVALTPSNRISK